MGEKTLEWLIEIDGKEERFVEAAAYFEARRVGAMLVGRKEEDVSLLSNLPRAPARYSSQFLPLCNPVASKKKKGLEPGDRAFLVYWVLSESPLNRRSP